MALIASLAVLLGGSGSWRQDNTSQKVRVAEGQYKVYKQTNAGGIGPFAPSVFDFSETWSLWRWPDGTFEVEGTRNYESPSDEPHSDQFTVHLSPDFRIVNLQESRKLRWRPKSGPLDCQFLPTKLACTSDTENPAESAHLDLPLHGAYGFLWPVSAFSLGHITRFVEHTPASVIPVQMVVVDEPSAANPVFASVLEGHLKYVGHERISVADREWQSDKFELTLPLHAPFLVWTSPTGLLLDFAEEDNHGRVREQGMKLVRYQQWLDF